ncbi:MAG: HPr(Ser) kinase/phosphatase [Oscillospiraceae bacterium]
MESRYHVPLDKIIQELSLEVLCAPEDYENIQIKTEDVNRPGLPLAGFFDYFVPQRIQLIGLAETTYLTNLTPEERRESFERLFTYEIPALIIAHGLEPFPECIEMAQKYGRVVLRTPESTTNTMSGIISFLRHMLCPRITRHGVLVEVYGEGLLLLGESGVGKSETAIELVKRGHRLIADDAVEIRRISRRKLIGSAPELIRHYLELRGIGVVDVHRLFGMSAVKKDSDIDLIVNLEPWKDDTVYDRLGTDEQFTTIFDVKVPTLTIPVKPGRNLAVIIEVAAMNNRNKKMGYNAALEFTKQINEHFDQAMSEQH